MVRLQGKRVTIKEVAREAGVSSQTVSRVINDRPDVASETRVRVREVIERLGYQPSALARSLIQQRSYTLGVVTAGLKYIGPSRTLNGITSAAEEMGYTLLLKELPRFDTPDVRPILNSLLARQVDGIIWAVAEIGNNHDCFKNLRLPLTVPMIFLTAEERPEWHVVTVDNYQGGRMATEHLLQRGYRHIGHVAGPLDWWEARQRKRGWEDALAEAGISDTDRQWVEGNWSPKSGETAFVRLLDQYPEMDAVFVANDQMALSTLLVAHRRGMQVPDDLGVVGFDGIPEAAYFWPPLTTVDQDNWKVGAVAVRELIHAIEIDRAGTGESQPGTIYIQPQLLVRKSSGGLFTHS